MSKKVTDLIRSGQVVIPADLLEKFKKESIGEIVFQHAPAPGIIIFPEEILARLGYSGLSKAGFDVVIVPRVDNSSMPI
jgi:hypothetical protein